MSEVQIEIVEAVFGKKLARKPRKASSKGKDTPAKKRSTQRRTKSRTLSSYKKELDSIFSIYIRSKFEKKCYTCEYTGLLQNGHFIPRQYLFTRWEEDNCRPQCRNCNVFRHGYVLEFEERLKSELGNERVEELKASRKKPLKLNKDFYEKWIEHYQTLVDKLNK